MRFHVPYYQYCNKKTIFFVCLFVCLFVLAFMRFPKKAKSASWHSNISHGVHASLQNKIKYYHILTRCHPIAISSVQRGNYCPLAGSVPITTCDPCSHPPVFPRCPAVASPSDPFHSIQGELLASPGPSYRQRRTFVPLSPNPTQKPAASDSLGPRLPVQRGSSIYDQMIVQRPTFNGSPRIPNRCSADRQ